MALAAIVVSISLSLAWRLEVVPGFEALLPPNRDSVRELNRVKEHTKGISSIFVVLEGDDTSALRGAADAIVVEVANPYERQGSRPALVEGMFVEVEFTAPPPEGSVVIPRSALRPGDQVWVVDDEARIRIRDVGVARAGVEQAVVIAGLDAGEKICTSNLQYVTEGMPVRVDGAAAPEASRAAADTSDHGGDAR